MRAQVVYRAYTEWRKKQAAIAEFKKSQQTRENIANATVRAASHRPACRPPIPFPQFITVVWPLRPFMSALPI